MFYINPLTWAFRAAVLNEFQSPEYDVCVAPAADGGTCSKLGQVRVGVGVGEVGGVGSKP